MRYVFLDGSILSRMSNSDFVLDKMGALEFGENSKSKTFTFAVIGEYARSSLIALF